MYNSLLLDEMSRVDIENIRADALRDISTISIDQTLSQKAKLEQYLTQIGNPYCFIVDGTPVKIRFVRPERELSKSLGNYFSRLKQK